VTNPPVTPLPQSISVPVQIALPYLRCTECGSQLVHHLYAHRYTDRLMCVYCARHQPAEVIAGVSPDSEGWIPGVETMNHRDAIALLVRHGATVQLEA
jgi:recombinational DNA repair protein (RecF pathway)